MFDLSVLCAGVLALSLIAYVLFGGADFGGGVWTLFASGARKARQKEAIAQAIGPIWEANHVWLIFAVVVLFTAFPVAYSKLSVALHVPITLMLLGIVVRGTTFVFKHYDTQIEHVQKRWESLFAVSSFVTPIFLGVILGTVASGTLHWDENGVYDSGFFEPWMRVFPWLVGVWTLALFAFLAAVYLCVETSTLNQGDKEKNGCADLAEDFRVRALIASGCVNALAIVVLFAAQAQAPILGSALLERPWAWVFEGLGGLSGVGCGWALWRRHYVWARTLGALQAVAIVSGFCVSIAPFLIVPQVTISGAAAPTVTLRLLLIVGVLGMGLVIPSLIFLMRVFKGKNALAVSE